jgi:uncharacterized membrane protein (UPF0127 family)
MNIENLNNKLIINSLNINHVFNIAIPQNQQEKEKGLMDVNNIKDDFAMLFIAEWEQPMRMWMKGTEINLDMIFVKCNGKIHRIEKNATPHSEKKIWSHGLVCGVIEVKGGICEKLGIQVGDSVQHPTFSK